MPVEMHVCACVYAYVCLCMLVYACVCMCVHVYACVCMFVCMCMIAYACVCAYVCVRIHTMQYKSGQRIIYVIWFTGAMNYSILFVSLLRDYIVHCTLCTVQYSIHTIQCTVCTAYMLHIVTYTLYTKHIVCYVLYCIQCMTHCNALPEHIYCTY